MGFFLKNKKPILILGDANPDIVIPYGKAREALKAIAAGEHRDTNHLGVSTSCGGACANTASGCGKLGVPVKFMGKAGLDGFGKLLRDDFISGNVDTEYFILDENMFTCMVLAVIGEDSDRCLFVWPKTGAAHHQLLPQELPEKAISEVSVVHTSGIMLRDEPAGSSVVGFMEKCRENGVPVSLDLNLRIESRQMGDHFWDLVRRAVAASDIVLGSVEDEFCPLTGISNPIEALRCISDGKNLVIGRNGGDPVYVIDQGREFSVPAYKAKIVDTIGAGDVFNSGFLCALATGHDSEQAVIWGNACASYSLGFEGGRSCPTMDQMEAFIKNAPLNQ